METLTKIRNSLTLKFSYFGAVARSGFATHGRPTGLMRDADHVTDNREEDKSQEHDKPHLYVELRAKCSH